MKLKIKKISESTPTPQRAHSTDAGLDLVAVRKNTFENYTEYGTGLCIELPPGTVGLIFPRSSVSNKDVSLSNCVGVIDEGYRGEVSARFRRHKDNNGNLRDYSVGDKICQLVIVEALKPEIEVVEELSASDRGEGGYGSTDAKEEVKKTRTILDGMF